MVLLLQFAWSYCSSLHGLIAPVCMVLLLQFAWSYAPGMQFYISKVLLVSLELCCLVVICCLRLFGSLHKQLSLFVFFTLDSALDSNFYGPGREFAGEL